MWDSVLYHGVAALLNLNIWGGELVEAEDLPGRSPAVYVANHARSLGPIAVISSLPFRVYPWAIGDMMDWEKAPAYLERDFVQAELHLRPPLSMWLSRLIVQFSIRLLRGVKCVPVWQGDKRLETYHLSIDFLLQGRPLLIFPEDPRLPLDDVCGMRPFKKGFAGLGEMYFERSGLNLPFYPLAVHERLRQVKVGRAFSFNPNNDRLRERSRLASVLEAAIRNMLLEMNTRSYAGIPLPY